MELFETESLSGKTQPIKQEQVTEAYRRVRLNKGAAGVDNQSLEDFDLNRASNLYKLWNRMASGSYFPNAVKGVEIPKVDGSYRLLGIPTVLDRTAQQVARSVLEPIMEPIFHEDSYGYRPGRSAHAAIAKCEERCREYRWVIDMDIKGFFDNIDHELMMEVVKHYTSEKWLLMYIERWLKSPMILPDGQKVERVKGTPQGGVISPLLSNMFLHVVFDAWMQKHYADTKYGSVRWERYADDIIVHCKNEKQAKYLLNRIRERFETCKLELHREKTKIVYCKQNNRRGGFKQVKFDFLGFSFKPRRIYEVNHGNVNKWWGYCAGISIKSSRYIISQIRSRKIHRATGSEITQIAESMSSKLRGWINYFIKFYPSALHKVFSLLHNRLARWITNKYKKYRRRIGKARIKLQEISKDFPNLFEHWKYGYTP